jgi:hypothetical protein
VKYVPKVIVAAGPVRRTSYWQGATPILYNLGVATTTMKKVIGTLLIIIGLAWIALDVFKILNGQSWFPSILFGFFVVIAGWATLDKDKLLEVFDDIIGIFMQTK